MSSSGWQKSIFCLFSKKPGGEYITTKNICKQLLKIRKLKVVIKEIKNYCFTISRVKPRLLRNFLFNSIVFIKELRKTSRTSERFDYIYSPSVLLLFFAIFYPKFKKAKFIYHFHGFEYGESNKSYFQYIKTEKLSLLGKYFYLLPFLMMFSLIEKFVLKQAWKIFVPTRYSKSLILKRYPIIDRRKIYIIPNGLDEKVFYPAQKIKQKDRYQIMYIGRLVEEKGVGELIEALEVLDKNKYFLTIIYPIPKDKLFEKKIKSKVKNFKNIKIFKNLSQEKIGDFYRKVDLTILPSRIYFEQLPLVFLESLACGIPILVSKKIPGILKYQNEISRDLILSEISPREIAGKIELFFQLSESKRSFIRNQCLKIARDFSWRKTAKIFLKQFEN